MATTTVFQVELPLYTGPFDLLLAAIKDNKLAIFDVSISQITSAYFEHMRQIEKINLNAASEFLLMASLLLEMKSKKLLPQPEEIQLQLEEEEVEGDLLAHLTEYKMFQDIAQTLKGKKEAFKRVYSRYHREVFNPEKKDFFLKDVSLQDLVLAFKRVWDQTTEESNVRHIQDDDITLPQRVEEVIKMVSEAPDGVQFEQLFIRKTRIEIVVTFLAILELARRNKIKITQGARFGGIRLFTA